MTAAKKLTIDIYSDVMCPWCIIGYAQLQTGLAQLAGEIEAEVRWLPFELNPDMPPEGEPQTEHIMRKYGRTPDQAAAGREQMYAVGDQAGYSFAYTGPGAAPEGMMRNTFDAHKLLKWALIEGGPAVQTRLKLALFDAHFQQRCDVSNPDVLVELAAAQGLDADGARKALTDETLGQIVRHEQAQAIDMNITGVPAMLIQGKYMIPGAQEPEVYVNALRRVAQREGLAAQAEI